MTKSELFEQSIAEKRAELLEHPIYSSLHSLEGLRIFMQHHAFAVWDFMSLVKTLQRQLTCVSIPWMPPAQPLAARFINEIVVAEESDEVAPGEYLSHFDLYLRAMNEAGADTRPIRSLIAMPTTELLRALRMQGGGGVWDFMHATFRFVNRPTHEVAAAFLFGREDVIPQMFRQILQDLDAYHSDHFISFRRYLERHIEVDGDHHGPMAKRILAEICGDDDVKWKESRSAALEAIDARIQLWDFVLSEVVRADLDILTKMHVAGQALENNAPF